MHVSCEGAKQLKNILINVTFFEMNSGNRDLLVLTKYEVPNAVAMEQEVKFLNKLLFTVENLHTFCIVNEIIDVNRFKIVTKPHRIHKIIRESNIKPFVFVFNKN